MARLGFRDVVKGGLGERSARRATWSMKPAATIWFSAFSCLRVGDGRRDV